MKIAFAGKGGTGKTTIATWTADYLVRQGYDVWLIDADTAMSLGRASGLREDQIPRPLTDHKELIQERIGSGLIRLNPNVEDLPQKLSVEVPLIGRPNEGITPGTKRLLVMGTVQTAGSGCACGANALLKALLGDLLYDEKVRVIVDLEAGVEHLGRGTVEKVDLLAVVSELSLRSLETAAKVSKLAKDLGLNNQLLLLNRVDDFKEFEMLGDGIRDNLPEKEVVFPNCSSLRKRMISEASVLDLPEREQLDLIIQEMLQYVEKNN